MEPINYMLNVRDPFEGALRGAQAGLMLSGAMDAAKQQQLQIQQQQAQLEQQQRLNEELNAVSQKDVITPKDITSLIVRNPSLAAHYKDVLAGLNEDQKQARVDQASQVYSALQSGQTDIAKGLIDQYRDAAINSGDKRQADSMSAISKIIDANPQAALTSAGTMLASVMGPQQFTQAFSTIQKTPGEVKQQAAQTGLTEAQTRDIQSQITDRAARLNLDKDKLASEYGFKLQELQGKGTTLTDDARKIVNDSVVNSVASQQSADQMTDLADRLDKMGGGYGGFSTAGEWLKSAFGNQNAMTQMRNEYTRIRNSQAMKLLPAGPASDKDVAMAMKGFPSETADSGTIASFLRGMAKMNRVGAAMDEAKSEWVNAVGHLGKPKTDIEVGGVNVPAGATFNDFAKKFITASVEQKTAQGAQQAIKSGQRSYMKYGQ